MRRRSVVFTDVVNSSGLLEQFGDARWVQAVERIHQLVTDVAVANAGNVVKSLGDGHLVVFDSPDAAICFAASLQVRMQTETVLEVPIPMRIGVHEGEVTEQRGDVHGRTVHVAARIGALAGAGQVLCSTAVHGAADASRWRFGLARTVTLRGLDGLHDVLELRWDATPEARQDPTPGPRLLDRGRERRSIDDLLQRALDGRGGIGLLEAPAGIGKSSLLRFAAERARAVGLTVIQARGDELEMDYAFGLVAQLLDQLVDEEDEALFAGEARFARPLLRAAHDAGEASSDGARERRALLAVCLRLAARQSLALIVDDAHWADVPSLRWLAQLVRRVDGEPLTILIAARPSQPGQIGELLTRIKNHAGIAHLEPRPLSAEGIRVIVERELGSAAQPFVDACGAATGGNPFLLGELLRSLREDGIDPQHDGAQDILVRHRTGLARVVLARLAGLGPQAIALAEAAATFPTGTPLRHAAALARLDPEVAATAADALTAAGVFAEGRPLRFVHPLTRQAIFDEVASGRRSRLHRAALQILADEDAPAQDQAAHAMLVEPAGDAEVLRVLRAAAERARGLGAPDVAARYLRRALEEPPPRQQRDEIRVALGQAERMVRAYESAIEVLAPVLSRASDSGLRRRALDELTACYGYGLHRWAEARALVEAELARLDDPTSDEYLQLEAQVWRYSLQTLSPTQPEEMEDAVSRIRGPGPGAAAVLAARADVIIWSASGSAAAAFELCRRALEFGFHEFVLEALAQDFERPEVALPHIETSFEDAVIKGDVPAQAFASRMLGDVAWATGDLLAAERHYGRADELIEGRNAIVSLSCARVRLARGDIDGVATLLGARGLLGEPERAAEALGHARMRAPLWNLRGELALAAGELARAETEMRRAKAELCWKPWPDDLRLSELLLRSGRREEALVEADELVTSAQAIGTPSRLGRALALRARCLPTAGATVAAMEAEPLALLASGIDRLAEAEGRLIYGEGLRRAGRPRDARPVLAQARVLADRCGAEPLARRAREEQRLAGAKPRRIALDGAEALTASERRVAELAAQGVSNVEIAGTLVLSVRTIEMHLGRTYRKLGVTGRRDLAAAINTVVDPVAANGERSDTAAQDNF